MYNHATIAMIAKELLVKVFLLEKYYIIIDIYLLVLLLVKQKN